MLPVIHRYLTWYGAKPKNTCKEQQKCWTFCVNNFWIPLVKIDYHNFQDGDHILDTALNKAPLTSAITCWGIWVSWVF